MLRGTDCFKNKGFREVKIDSICSIRNMFGQPDCVYIFNTQREEGRHQRFLRSVNGRIFCAAEAFR